MKLSVYIEQLLHAHDCVIVPHFGGFIANYQSASINWSSQKIAPPTKSVLFNPNLIHNDGLLGHTVSADLGITYPAALTFIQDQVKLWQTALDKGKRLEIGEIGFLFKDANQVIFEQSRELNILLSAYGLSAISFVNFAAAPVLAKAVVESQPIAQKTEKEPLIIALNSESKIEEVKVVEVDEKVVPITSHRNRRILRYSGIAAAIPLMFYTYWIPMETDFIDTGKIQFADFNPIRKAPERTYQLRHDEIAFPTIETLKSWEDVTANLSDNVKIYNYQFDDQLYIPIRLDKTATAVSAEIDERTNQSAAAVSEGSNYHVIGGCFSIKENAEKLAADMRSKGFQASIFDLKGGLYRVSVGDYSTSELAEQKLGEFTAQGFSGWILNK
jgi:hypothetical protein